MPVCSRWSAVRGGGSGKARLRRRRGGGTCPRACRTAATRQLTRLAASRAHKPRAANTFAPPLRVQHQRLSQPRSSSKREGQVHALRSDGITGDTESHGPGTRSRTLLGGRSAAVLLREHDERREADDEDGEDGQVGCERACQQLCGLHGGVQPKIALQGANLCPPAPRSPTDPALSPAGPGM